MKIGGIQKQSLIEYPGKISAVIFIGGCNFRCPFCYVPHLVLPERIRKIQGIPEREVFSFLTERKDFLEAVMISGGEPTIYPELLDFVKKIKEMNYLVGIETNGSNPEMLQILINEKLIDYIAMDIKNDFVFEKYNLAIGGGLTKELLKKIKKSTDLLLENKVDYELRTTLVKEIHKKKDIIEICKKIKKAKVYFLQSFVRTEGGTISGKDFTPFSEKELQEIVEEGKKYTNIKPRFYL